ncbi:hypothetical protein GHT06_012417 [Daphnia sinensis]|uniref:CSC1/OSCA1-like cytosolic domain-containing protein n=1 Tax=Daphnia sinensis TaxID=1820382 RepID=A0AAD5KXJ2_9CRUS|nr:hypothetical protein GHT06_012417 [Daphnia sinensis]
MNQTMNVSVNPELQVNTSNCSQPDAYDISIQIGWFNEWIVWEGGIAFHAAYWSVILLISFALLYFLKWKFKWWCLCKRFDGTTHPPTHVKMSWADWLSLSIDEEAVGKDGATFLWFQYRLIQVDVLRIALGIILIIMHYYGDKLGERPYKTVRSTDCTTSAAILTMLAWLMRQHGQNRCIRSLASHQVISSVCNRKWLMITGIPLTTTIDSLLDYMKKSFDLKGICREDIVMAKDVSQLLPVVNQIHLIRNIKQHLNGPAFIRRRFWKFWDCHSTDDTVDTVMHGPEFKQHLPEDEMSSDQEIDAATYYNLKEEALLVKKESLLNNLEFTGTVFIHFDSPAEAKVVKKTLTRRTSKWFWNRNSEEDPEFQPSQWTVRYPPPSADINWSDFKKPRPIWRTLALYLRLALTYSIYIILMAAPASVIRWLHLEGHGLDESSIYWKRFVLPTIVSFFTTELTDWVTGQDQQRRHLTVTAMCLASLRSICYLNVILYFIRMLAMKPLPVLLAGKFYSEDFRLECLFFPVHGSFVACCIIVNTASGILMNHLRIDCVLSYLKNWLKFRSDAEQTAFKDSYRMNFDFASRYAELTSNFALTSFFMMIFPVISLVSFCFSILRFLGDRTALTEIYSVSHTGHDLHKESINMVLRFAIASPLALIVYRRIQLGPTVQFLDPGVVAPLSLLILYVMYLLYAHFKSSRKEDSTEHEEDLTQITAHEYDPVAQIRAETLLGTHV